MFGWVFKLFWKFLQIHQSLLNNFWIVHLILGPYLQFIFITYLVSDKDNKAIIYIYDFLTRWIPSHFHSGQSLPRSLEPIFLYLAALSLSLLLHFSFRKEVFFSCPLLVKKFFSYGPTTDEFGFGGFGMRFGVRMFVDVKIIVVEWDWFYLSG